MAAIEKKQPDQQGTRDTLRLGIRFLVVIYLSYIIYQLVTGYLSGASSMSLPVVALFVLFFAAAVVVILVLTLRQWKKSGQSKEDDPHD